MLLHWIKKNTVAILATITMVGLLLVPTTLVFAQEGSAISFIKGPNNQIVEKEAGEGIIGWIKSKVEGVTDLISNFLGAIPVLIGRIIQAI